MTKKLFILVILLFLSIPAFAQVDTAWVRKHYGAGHAIAVDGFGNVCVATRAHNASSNDDYTTIRYYPNGDTAWTRVYNGPGNGNDCPYDIEVDRFGNIYVTGVSLGTVAADIATIKYLPNGDTAWVRRYEGVAYAITVDSSCNVYVTGMSGTDCPPSGNPGYCTVKYDSAGNILWVARYCGPGDHPVSAKAIAVDGPGNVYVTGDYATVKYYSNGDTAWSRKDGSFNAIAVDHSGNVYVTGGGTIKYDASGNRLWTGSWGGFDIALDSSRNVYITGGNTAKYYSNGDTAWVRGFQGEAYDVAVDGLNNVYVAGGYSPNGGYVTMKYYFNGEIAWVATYGGVYYDFVSDLALDASGNVFVTGVTFASEGNGATIKYIQSQPVPIAHFSASPRSGKVPCTVQFTDLSVGDPTSWFWNFGDGNTGTLRNPTHVYNDTGYFDVKLVVSNLQGRDSLVKEDYIHVLPSTPVLSWSLIPGYTTDGVFPDTGLERTLFTFRAVYSDSSNMQPQTGYPKVNIDLNGDGDFNDVSEGSFTMGEMDADTNYVNGREYLYNVILPVSPNCQYSFTAKNSYGVQAIGEPTNLKAGPVILSSDSALDIYIRSSDITFSNPHPDEGENFTVFATVHNNSDSNLTGVSVTFYHSGELLDQVMLSNVPSHGSATTSTQISFGTRGFYPIRVIVDEENSFQEWNELNNFAMRPIIVGDYQFPGGIVVQAQLNTPVYPYSWITVTGNAHYTPGYLGPVSGATVKVTVHETGAEYTNYTNDPGNFSIGFYGPSQAGNYSVIVEVTDYTLTDSTILNLNVLPPQSGVDLTIRMTMPETGCLSENQENTVDVKILNLGDQDAQNFWTCIYKDASLYYSYWVNQLPAGDSLQLDTIVSFPSIGWHTLTGIVDAGDSVSEYNEGNNISTLSRYVSCNAPDIAIINMVFSDHVLKGERPIDITAWVVDLGGVAVNETFGVVFSDNGIPFDTQYITSLAPCGTQTVYVVSDSFIYSDTLSHSFSVFADFENVITECNEENNIYYSSISAWPDLWPRNLEFSRDCFTWGDSLWFQVDIYNVGEVKAESVWVRFLLDEVQIGGDVFVDSILPGAGHYDTKLSAEPWIVPEELDVTHICRVVVDPDNEIPEIREDNNELTRATPVVRCGDVNRDCDVNIADIVLLINYMFKNGPVPNPFPAADVNHDQTVDVGDVVYLINYLFKGGPPPSC